MRTTWLALVVGVTLVLAPEFALAQTEKPWRIGVLTPERQGALEAIVEGLGELRAMSKAGTWLWRSGVLRAASTSTQVVPIFIKQLDELREAAGGSKDRMRP